MRYACTLIAGLRNSFFHSFVLKKKIHELHPSACLLVVDLTAVLPKCSPLMFGGAFSFMSSVIGFLGVFWIKLLCSFFLLIVEFNLVSEFFTSTDSEFGLHISVASSAAAVPVKGNNKTNHSWMIDVDMFNNKIQIKSMSRAPSEALNTSNS